MVDIFELIWEKCPNGVTMATVGEIGTLYGGLSGKGKDDFKNGNARFASYTNVYTNMELDLTADDKVVVSADENQRVLQRGDIIFTGSSETPGECGFSSVVVEEPAEPWYLNSFCFFLRLDDVSLLLPGFSKYLFRSENLRKQIIATANGITRFNVSKAKFLKIKIPLPPLQIQREIVAILDKFDAYCNSITAGLAGELEMRRKQYRYWAEELLSNPAYPQVKAGSLFMRMRTKAKAAPGGKVCSMTKDHGLIDKQDFEAMGRRARTSDDTSNYLAIPCRAFCYDPTHLDIVTINWNKYDVPCYVSPIFSGFSIDETKLMPEFLELWFHTDMFSRQREQFTEKGARVKFDYSNWNRISMPLPDLQEQVRLVGILGEFRELERELELRRKQYGYYRDMLLAFSEQKGA